MLKNCLIAGIALASTTGLAFANGVTTHHPYHFYLGQAISRDAVSFDATQNWVRVNNAVTSVHHLGRDGWNGEIFGGYGLTFRHYYYLGAELFASISDTAAEYRNTARFNASNTVTDSKKVKLEHSYGVSLMPGVWVSPDILLYERVGWIRSRFELNGTLTGTGGNFSSLNLPYGAKTTKGGIQLGVGIGAMVTKHLSCRLEYDWSRYGSISAAAGAIVNGQPFTYNASLADPTVNQFKLALVYHFNAAA